MLEPRATYTLAHRGSDRRVNERAPIPSAAFRSFSLGNILFWQRTPTRWLVENERTADMRRKRMIKTATILERGDTAGESARVCLFCLYVPGVILVGVERLAILVFR